LFRSSSNDTVLVTAQTTELKSPCGATVKAEMKNAVNQRVVLKAAGMLILQLGVAVFAQETVAPPNAAPGSSALPAGKIAAAGSSQSQVQPGADSSGRGAVQQPEKAGGKGDPSFGGERHPLYRLAKSDSVEVNFTFSPEFNQTLTVQPDGFVALRGAGTLLAEGRTVPDLQEAITDAYRGFLHNPEITVTLKEFDKPYFLASGEVTRPGKYELRSDLTVNEAVAIAGGFTQQARHSQVVLFRRVSGELAESHLIDLKKMLDRRDLHEDLHLQPGDFIYVPLSRIAKIRRYVPTNSMSWYMNPMQF